VRTWGRPSKTVLAPLKKKHATPRGAWRCDRPGKKGPRPGRKGGGGKARGAGDPKVTLHNSAGNGEKTQQNQLPPGKGTVILPACGKNTRTRTFLAEGPSPLTKSGVGNDPVWGRFCRRLKREGRYWFY